MKVVITGGLGFIGRAIAERLRANGHTVTAVSLRTPPSAEAFAGCGAVVNLSGEPVAQRWTAAAKERIMNSRVQGTRTLVAALRQHPPAALISASAIGYYGSRGAEILTEESPPGSGFLGQVAVAWEQEARAAEEFGVRVVTPRIGVVLGRGGGALPQIALPFRFGVGGRLGDGKQWTSWIHLDDLISLVEFSIATSTLRGAVNAVAPNPVTNAEFTRELAAALHRPAILPVPTLALKILLGEMSQAILASQRVIPQAALRAGFQFRFTEVGEALRHIFAA
ncbi:MAG: TIGR01777 family oxidoreductase [Acidobacteriota bacterium]|nr:TIGR01777 family oxidoreductase [Acidobacteriota bacterium]